MRGGEFGPLHGLPVGIKDLEEVAGLRTTYGSPIFRDFVPEADCGMVARIRAAGGIVLGKTNTPEFGAGANTRNARLRRDRQPLRPDALRRRLLRRLGGGARHRHGAALLRLRHRRLARATRRRSAASSASGRAPAWCRPRSARSAGPACPCSGRWRGTCRTRRCCSRPWPRTMRPTRSPTRCTRGRCAAGRRCSTPCGSSTRPPSAWPSARISARRRSRRRCAPPSARWSPPRRSCSATAPRRIRIARTATWPSRCSAPASSSIAHGEKVRTRPEDVGPNIHRQCGGGAPLQPGGPCPRRRGADPHLPRLPALLRPMRTCCSRPPSRSARGPGASSTRLRSTASATRTYFHWLALAYYVTLTGHPGGQPAGRHRRQGACPSACRSWGRAAGDAFVLGVAAALEEAFASDPELRRPVPDIAALRAAPPISGMEGFLGFG